MQIQRLNHGARVHADEHAIDDDTRGGIKVFLDVRGADTANRDRSRATRALLQVIDDDVGCGVGEGLQVNVGAPFDFGGSESADGCSDILQIFRTLSGRDSDFFEHALIHGVICRVHRGAKATGGQSNCGRNEQLRFRR